MHNFNPEYDNAHGYINMICTRAFIQYNRKEKSHSEIKQSLYKKDDPLDGFVIDYETLLDKK